MCSAPQTQRCSLLPGASTAEAAVGRRRRLQGNLLTALPIPSQRRRSCFLPPPFSLLPIQSQPIRNKTEVSNRCKSSFISIHQQQSRDQQQLTSYYDVIPDLVIDVIPDLDLPLIQNHKKPIVETMIRGWTKSKSRASAPLQDCSHSRVLAVPPPSREDSRRSRVT
uniref:Uncharacterized protein n=1 Tax=Oryza rufipogon TaxID=4529 RepID=A0A0E0N2A6_ORYRU